jgi:hypothetical protein
VKPCRKGAPLTDRFRQAGQAEKDGLEDILGIVRVIDQSTGGPQNHGAVAGDEPFKRLAIISRDEAIQQRGVFRRHGFIAQPAKVSLQPLDRSNGHASLLVGKRQTCLISTRGRGSGSSFFPFRPLIFRGCADAESYPVQHGLAPREAEEATQVVRVVRHAAADNTNALNAGLRNTCSNSPA